MFSSLLGARDDVFALIPGRQQPRHTTGLYKIAGQLCGLLSILTFDLGHPHTATTHAPYRAALRRGVRPYSLAGLRPLGAVQCCLLGAGAMTRPPRSSRPPCPMPPGLEPSIT